MSERRSQPALSRSAAAEPCPAGQPEAPVPTWFVAIATVLISALREIFDESAYSRFLSRHEMTSCPRAYAAFLREQEGLKTRRAKCC
jgi:hypothetical protein